MSSSDYFLFVSFIKAVLVMGHVFGRQLWGGRSVFCATDWSDSRGSGESSLPLFPGLL